MASKRLIRLPQVTEKTGYSGSHIYDMAGKGNFPKPVKLGPRASAWVEEEVDRWIDERIAASRQENGAAA